MLFELHLTQYVQVSIAGNLSISQLTKIQLVASLSWSELGTAQPQLVFPFFGASVRRSSGRRSGGRLLATTQWPLFSSVFSFFFFFFPVFFSVFFFSVATFSHRRSALIKKIILRKLTGALDLVGHYGAPLVAICRRLVRAPGAARLVLITLEIS